MQIKQFAALGVLTTFLVACGGGDINIAPATSNDDNSVIGDDNDFSVTNGGGDPSVCASYEEGGITYEGNFIGTDCIYGTDFVDFNNPLLTDVTIPFIGSGAHIFQGSLWVGESYDTAADAAAAGITEGGDGPTLTIEAGSTVALQTSADFIVINRGSQIQAVGTESAPITFTSATDVLGTIDPEAVSQWGGMVINGFGVTNGCTYTGTYGTNGDGLTIVGDCSRGSEGSEGEQANTYGGNNDADSSGTLQYVVVKHTGAEVANGDELNGITFSGVGSGTTVSYIQAYSTFDDGIEFFGGAVDVDHYVALYVNDDSIDLDEGYRGTIQYALVIQSETDGNRCVEADGVGSHSEAKAASDIAQGINSQPTIDQLTCIISPNAIAADGGTGTREDPGQGFRLREGLFPTITNALVTTAYLPEFQLGDDDYNYCFRVTEGQTMQSVADADGNVSVEGSIFACQDLADSSTATPDGGAEITLSIADQVQFLTDSGNQAYQSAELGEDPTADVANGLEILDGYYSLPVADMLVGGAAITTAPVNGATFIGGVEASDDWTSGWTYGLEAGNRGQPLYFE